MSEAKASLRKALFAARKQAKASGVERAAQTRLAEVLAPFYGERLAGYMPIRTEVDPLPVMADFAAHGVVAVPVIEAEARPLRFARWTPETAMVAGAFGAHIPETCDWITPEVLIVPLVGFDGDGGRLGYGGGFYDRTLELLRARGPVTAIGFAFEAQRVDALPQEPTDQPLDMIVTEARVLRPSAPSPNAPTA